MADVLKIFLLVVGTQIVLVAYWLAAVALLPKVVDRAGEVYRRHPWRSVLIGAALGGPIVVLGFGLLQAGSAPVKVLGFLMVSAATLGGLLGSAALCRRLGAGLPSPIDSTQPWRQVLRGGIVLVLTFLLPFLGWFLILPVTLASGLGTVLLTAAIRLRRRAAAPRVSDSGEVALP
ncbi:MAG: hypothetical protein AAF657_37610 [Acidobacteriota bacterium]